MENGKISSAFFDIHNMSVSKFSIALNYDTE